MVVLWAGAAWGVQGDAGEDLDAQHHEERYDVYNVLDYGAIPNDSVDDTDEIKAALTACAATAPNGRGKVVFPIGTFRLSDTAPGDGYGFDFDTCTDSFNDCTDCVQTTGVADGLCDRDGILAVPNTDDWCPMESLNPDKANTTFEWVGTDGVGTAFNWNFAAAGEFITFQGFAFRGTNQQNPRYWLKLKGPDRYTVFRNLWFLGGYVGNETIPMTGMYVALGPNNSFEWLRFDNLKWAMEVVWDDSIDGSNFALDHFTIDSQAVSGAADPHGFIYAHCDTSLNVPVAGCGARNVGTLHISNGRIEALGTEDFHAFSLDPTDGGEVRYGIDNVTMRQTTGTPVNCAISLDPEGNGGAPAASARMQAVVTNSQLGGQKLCGWGADYNVADFNTELQSPNWSVGHRNSVLYMPGTTAEAIKVSQDANGKVLCAYNRDDAESSVVTDEKWTMCLQGDGDIQWSNNPGTIDNDVNLGPAGVEDEITFDADDSLCFGNSALCLRWDATPGCLYFDTNDDSVCDAGEVLGGCSCS